MYCSKDLYCNILVVFVIEMANSMEAYKYICPICEFPKHHCKTTIFKYLVPNGISWDTMRNHIRNEHPEQSMETIDAFIEEVTNNS